ncbi:MAG: hypothetical protein WA777_18495 [Rhodanobacter sp.]
MNDDQGASNTPASSSEIQQLRREVRELSGQIHDLVEAWNMARGLVRFVKALGRIATAIAGIGLLARMIWKGTGK